MAEVFTGTKEKDQYQRRQHGVILRDQWDRRWETTVDTDSGGPCAPINPKGWTDILNTPAKFKRLVKDEDGRLGIEIAVDDWIADNERAHDKYDQDLYNDAMMLFGAEGPKAYEERTPGLINYTGLGPPATEPILALRDGNSWVLGKTSVPDKRLAQYFVKRVRVRPSFKDVDPETLEEQHDPEATGGKKQPVRHKKDAAAA